MKLVKTLYWNHSTSKWWIGGALEYENDALQL